MLRISRVSLGVTCLVLLASIVANEPARLAADNASKSTERIDAQLALEQFNGLVGGWRGVGQPVRGSTKGSWTETAEWVWDIRKDHVSLKYVVTDGKLLETATLTYLPEQQKYALQALLPDGTARSYTGGRTGTKLVLESTPDAANYVHLLTITPLNEKRTLILFQQRKADQGQFARVAEIGYTREGTRLAVEGEGEPECIVSGGKGTSTIVYKGKTYWFCCTGCRDAFNDDPEGILAEAALRAARKKEKAEQEKAAGTKSSPK